MDEPTLTFVERSDLDAHASLSTVQERLRTAGATARLLRGRDEPRTFLLIVSGDAALTAAEAAGSRVWRFDTADAAAGAGAAAAPDAAAGLGDGPSDDGEVRA